MITSQVTAALVTGALFFTCSAEAQGNPRANPQQPAASQGQSKGQNSQASDQDSPAQASLRYTQHQQKYPGATALNPYGSAMQYDRCSMRAFYY